MNDSEMQQAEHLLTKSTKSYVILQLSFIIICNIYQTQKLVCGYVNFQ